MKASDLLVRALENEGVQYVFGIPGEENLDLLESFRTSSIELVLTGQKPIKKSKQGRFQIIDVVRMMEPVTKWSKQIVDANNIPHLVREAFRIAETEKPGPVHLELPEDVASEHVDRTPFAVTTVTPPGASAVALETAARMISEATRPLLCLAAGANRHRTQAALDAFVEKTGHRVTAAGRLEAQLGESLARGGVHVIEVPIDYAENDRVLGAGLRRATDELLAAGEAS